MGTNKKTFGTRTKLSTFGTGLASTEWSNLNYSNPSLHRFVSYEVLQLIETPAIKPEVKSSTFSCVPYSFDVFQHNSSSVAVINYCFADYMVPISFETSLSARNLLQEFLARTSAFALEPCSQSLEFESISLNFSSTKELPI